MIEAQRDLAVARVLASVMGEASSSGAGSTGFHLSSLDFLDSITGLAHLSNSCLTVYLCPLANQRR